jgi:hypothetical protein
MKVFRKLLRLGQDIGNPFPYEHEWLYNLINSYDDIDKNEVYSLFGNNTDYISIRQDFMITILTDVQQYYDTNKYKDVYNVVNTVIELWKKDPTKQNKQAWRAAESAAYRVYHTLSECRPYSYDCNAAITAAYSVFSEPNRSVIGVANSAANNAQHNAGSVVSVGFPHIVAKQVEQFELLCKLIVGYSHE